MSTEKHFKCAVCGSPREGTSREFDRTRKNALCPDCFNATGICKCSCGRTFPLYNGHGHKREFAKKGCYFNVPEIAERANKQRSQSMRKAWQTDAYRKARQDPDKFAKTPKDVREKGKENWKRIYRANRDRYDERTREYRKKNRRVYVEAERRRNLRKRGTKTTITSQQWQDILVTYHHKCAYCGKKGKLQQDHIIPLSKGGDHSQQNVIPACQRCNRTKSAGPPPVPVQPVLL